MKIIVAGIYLYPMYQEALASGLESIRMHIELCCLMDILGINALHIRIVK